MNNAKKNCKHENRYCKENNTQKKAAVEAVAETTPITIEQTKGYKVQISFINLQKTADIAINERTYIYDRCTLQLPPGRNPLR